MPKSKSRRHGQKTRKEVRSQPNKNESQDRGRGQMGQSDDVTPPQRRHHGLYNQGATCYLNSVLQVLFMTTEIHDRLDPQTDRELRQIFMDLKRKTCGTENITKSLEIQNVHEQRDAAECLQKILHHISPEASEVFRGQLRDTTKCFKGHIINEETNPFWTLPLSLKDSRYSTYSVESSFERTFQTKTFSSGNMMYCNDCEQKTEATSRCEMVEAPQILTLLLKRFDFDYITRSHFRSDCCVEVPCELQLKNKTYKLYGMVNHMGSIRGGHYTATVLSEDNAWYECNDSYVSEVKHQLFAEDRTFSSRMVYLLTYRATELNDESEGLKSKKPSKRHLDEETTTEKEGQRAPKKLHETTSPSQTDDAAERQDESSKVDEQMQAEVEDTRKDVEMDTSDEKKRQMGHSDVVTQTQRPHYDPNNQEASHSLNSVQKAPEMHDRIRTAEEDDSVNVGEQPKDSCEQHLDEETMTAKEEQRECQKPVETTSEDHTDEVGEEQGEDVGPAGLKGDEEPKRNTDDEETTQMGHSAEDEGQMGKDSKEERLQARGEEGDAENVETDTSINNHTTVSEVKSSEDEEAQGNEDSNTRENGKSGEFNETRVEDASVNVGDKWKDSCEQHLAEETKTEKEEQRATECQKPVGTTSEDPTVELEEEQGEDIGPEELKGDEEPKRNTDNEETTQKGHSAEDEGQMREDRKEERLQARGEEGDAETKKTKSKNCRRRNKNCFSIRLPSCLQSKTVGEDIGPAEDEGQMREDRNKERLQARGEEGDAKTKKTKSKNCRGRNKNCFSIRLPSCLKSKTVGEDIGPAENEGQMRRR